MMSLRKKSSVFRLCAVILLTAFALLSLHFLAHAGDPDHEFSDCYACKFASAFLIFLFSALVLFHLLQKKSLILAEIVPIPQSHLLSLRSPRAPPHLS